jgi:hypothetical protein
MLSQTTSKLNSDVFSSKCAAHRSQLISGSFDFFVVVRDLAKASAGGPKITASLGATNGLIVIGNYAFRTIPD